MNLKINKNVDQEAYMRKWNPYENGLKIIIKMG